jgi:hypothetical protein
VVLATASGSLIVLALGVLGMMSSTLRPATEVALQPGYWWPEHYWGGVHDPLQVLVVFVLNVVFYGAAIFSFLTWKALDADRRNRKVRDGQV